MTEKITAFGPRFFLLCLCLSLAVAGCGLPAQARGVTAISPAVSPEQPALNTVVLETATPNPTATRTPVPTFTGTPTQRPIPTMSPTATWVFWPGGQVDVPVLLYHHVGEPEEPSPYYVSPEAFRVQMECLREWGYTSISMTRLAGVLVSGGSLPEHPVVITFDDGYRDVYRNAFPVMQELGFTGVFYLVSEQVGTGSYIRVSELKKMAAAGWEFGNHSATHRSLVWGYSADLVQDEIIQSRLDLEDLLGVPIQTFSYPYGLASKALKQQIKDLGYLAAVGVEATWRHSLKTMYFLGRSEVRSNFDIHDFMALLPYSGTIPLPPTLTPDY